MNIRATIAILIVVLIAGNVVQGFRSQALKEKRDRYKTERNQARADLLDCQTQQEEVYEIADDLEKQLATVNADRSSLMRRLRNGATVCATGTAAGIDHATPGGQTFPSVVGIEAAALVEKFASCDVNTERLIAAQTYIKTICLRNYPAN